MGRNLKEAIERHRQASDALHEALRACIGAIKDKPDNVVEGRFRPVEARHRRSRTQERAKM